MQKFKSVASQNIVCSTFLYLRLFRIQYLRSFAVWTQNNVKYVLNPIYKISYNVKLMVIFQLYKKLTGLFTHPDIHTFQPPSYTSIIHQRHKQKHNFQGGVMYVTLQLSVLDRSTLINFAHLSHPSQEKNFQGGFMYVTL